MTSEPPFGHSSAEASGDTPGPLPVRVGSYQIVRCIESGGMGSVYEAWQDEPRRLVALKLLQTSAASPTQLKRFRVESEALGSLQHANIAQIYEAGTHTQGELAIPYFAMERVRGARTIVSFVRENKLAWANALRLFLPVIDAVQHAHTQRILHRDLKPSNILVDEAGIPKVIDFGVAKFVDRDAGATLTDAALLVGTLQYMSPEQSQQNPVDQRSDQYSLAVVLYEIVCGRPPYPFEHGKLVEMARTIADTSPRAPGHWNAALPPDLSIVLLKALAKAPRDRYPTLPDFARDLQHVLAGEPIEARGLAPWTRAIRKMRRWGGNHPVVALATASIIACAAGYNAGWHVDSWGLLRRFEVFVTTRLNYVPDVPPKDVRLIAFTDVTDFGRLAREQNLPAIDPTFNPSLRPLHAKLLDRLRGSGAKVVAVDIAFGAPAPQLNQALADSLALLKSSGLPCVLARKPFDGGDDDVPTIDPKFAPLALPGFIQSNASASAPWSIYLAVQRGNATPRPSLALMTVAAFQGVRSPRVVFDQMFVTVGSGAQTLTVPHSYINPAGIDSKSIGIQQGDLIAHCTLEMPPKIILDASVTEFGDVLRADDATVAKWFKDKAVIVGDLRDKQDGPFPHASGREITGVFAHVVAVQALLDRRIIRWLPDVQIGNFIVQLLFPMLVLSGVLGALTARLCSNRKAYGTLVAAAALPVAASLISYQFGGWLWSPTGCCLSVLIGFAACRFLFRPVT